MSILWCSTLVLTVARSALRASLGRFKRSREKERKCHDGAWNTLAKIHRKRKKSSRHFSLAWRAPRDTGSVSDTRPRRREPHSRRLQATCRLCTAVTLTQKGIHRGVQLFWIHTQSPPPDFGLSEHLHHGPPERPPSEQSSTDKASFSTPTSRAHRSIEVHRTLVERIIRLFGHLRAMSRRWHGRLSGGGRTFDPILCILAC